MLWLGIFYLHAFQNKPPLLRNKRHSTVGSCFLITEERTASNIHSVLQSSTNQIFCFYFSDSVFRKMIVVFPFWRTNYADHCVRVQHCLAAAFIHNTHCIYDLPPPSSSFPFSTGTLSPTVFIPSGLY